MSIKVARNAAGNCVVFYGQTNPVYFNACLSAEVDGDYVSIKNDIASTTTETSDIASYEFYQLHFSEWLDEEGATFDSAQAVADYITEIGNVTDVPTGGYSFGPADTLDFTRDETNTSVLFSNGDHHGVNAVKAVLKENGRVGISSVRGDFEFYELDHFNCTIAGQSAGNNLNDVVNNLNAYFTMSAFTAPTSAPVYTMTGGQQVTEILGPEAQDLGNDQAASSVSSPGYHGAHVYTSGADTIDQPGEHFIFQIKNEATFLMGLYDVNNSTHVAALTSGSGSGSTGVYWTHGFHPTPNGPWTNYGPGGLVYGPGWNGAADKRFNTGPAGAGWLAGDWTQIKVGIDENGFAYLSYYDVDRSNEWIMISRSSAAAPNSEYGLIIKMCDANGRVLIGNSAGAITRYATDPAAPTLYYKYIESPDGNFVYPLFATEEEANFVDSENGGSGTSHSHTYVDDPTGTTWYMPDTGGTMDGTSAPTDPKYAEIPSGVDADFVPPVYTQADLTQEEGTVVNLPIQPLDVDYSSSVTISPAGSGLVYNSGTAMLQGTLADVGADTTYTVTVTRANSYGSSTGSFTITATDVAPVTTNDTSWNKALDFSGSSERTEMVTSNTIWNPMMMAGTNNQVAAPTAGQTVSFGHPWATSIVFKADGHNSNQHVWNLGEGAGTNDDNIYLRLSATRKLYFGWGRDGDFNECEVADISGSISGWHGVYVGHNGARFGDGCTAAQLASAFDIRYTRGNLNWAVGSNVAVEGNWTVTGGRMNRQYQGKLTLGGRGANRSFHGKIASFVTTTLKLSDAMPSDAEITAMITDPVSWVDDYKVGNDYRVASGTQNFSNFQRVTTHGNGTYTAGATQVWLMGDGPNDSYSNMIRNYVQPMDQNNTKMNMISMVSNDIQTVNIQGLT